jgi:aldehyde dehydrogenase (NAD(P)+)
MATAYTGESPTAKVCLVLGAGNIASIPPLDLLYKLFAEGQVCAVKLNPINDYLGPFLEQVFEEFIERGFVRFVYGGADVGNQLVNHGLVEEIHITGSAATHDAIVFGSGEQGAERKARNEPVLHKRITSELGGISPTIVVPGPWTDADLRFQAGHIATQKLHNAGHNCVATQVLVVPDTWDKTDALIEQVRKTIRNLRPREPYYPGSADRQREAVAAYPDAEELVGEVPKTLIPAVDPAGEGEHCFCTEFFGPTLAVVRLPGDDAGVFLDNAVNFANEKLDGTLGANILIDPKTAKQRRQQLDQAVADLRYGGIGVNAWCGLAFLLLQCSWGAFPGHTLADIQSGIGVVHNSFLFDRPQKSVVWAPFRPYPRTLLHGEFHLSPKPPWFVTNRTAHTTGRRLTRFSANPGWGKLPGIFASALLG